MQTRATKTKRKADEEQKGSPSPRKKRKKDPKQASPKTPKPSAGKKKKSKTPKPSPGKKKKAKRKTTSKKKPKAGTAKKKPSTGKRKSKIAGKKKPIEGKSAKEKEQPESETNEEPTAKKKPEPMPMISEVLRDSRSRTSRLAAAAKSAPRRRGPMDRRILDRDDPESLYEHCVYSLIECFVVELREDEYRMVSEWLVLWQGSAGQHHDKVTITRHRRAVGGPCEKLLKPCAQEFRQIVKIRILNKHGEPSGLESQFVGIGLCFEWYWCHSRGPQWGGWEFYQRGVAEPLTQHAYSAEEPPHYHWKKVCWVENLDPASESMKHPRNLESSTLHLFPGDIEAMLGTLLVMRCALCGESEDACLANAGLPSVQPETQPACPNFFGRFCEQDLFDRHACLLMTPTLEFSRTVKDTMREQEVQDRENEQFVKQRKKAKKKQKTAPKQES